MKRTREEDSISYRIRRAEEEFIKEPQLKLYENPITRIVSFFRINKILDSLEGENQVVEVGCQQGYIMEMLRQRGLNIIGFDLAESPLKKRVNKDLEVFRADAYHMPLKSSSCDVLCTEVLEHVPDHFKMLKEIIRVAKGEAIITIPNQRILNFLVFFLRPSFYKKGDPYHYPLRLEKVESNLKKLGVNYKIIAYPSRFFPIGHLIKIEL